MVTSSLWLGHHYWIIFGDNEKISNQRMLELEGAVELTYIKYIILQIQLYSVRTDLCWRVYWLLGSKYGKCRLEQVQWCIQGHAHFVLATSSLIHSPHSPLCCVCLDAGLKEHYIILVFWLLVRNTSWRSETQEEREDRVFTLSVLPFVVVVTHCILGMSGSLCLWVLITAPHSCSSGYKC